MVALDRGFALDAEAAARAERLLLDSFRAAVAAADPLRMVPPALPPPPKGRTLAVGAGKAAAAMARAVERAWPADRPLDGLVVTRHGHGYGTVPDGERQRIAVVEAGHPLPDAHGERAARRIVELVEGLGPDDLLLVLLSGGGSSLMALPVPPVAMADLQATTAALLKCGAPIQSINTVRKHLSQVQGGRLAERCKAPIVALAISDVVGDEPTHIASGPTVPDPTTYQEALDILEAHDCIVPMSVYTLLERGAAGAAPETPKPGSPAFLRARIEVIATARASLQAAANVMAKAGIDPVVLGDAIAGEAREVAKSHAAMALQARRNLGPFRPPAALISGGECTVTVRNPAGRGGRCTEYLLSLALELGAASRIVALAADTDGIDGSEDNAGAILRPDSLTMVKARGLDPRALLADNDAYRFFAAADGLVMTGPTRTNVNDYRAILIL